MDRESGELTSSMEERRSILIVDDEERFRANLQTLLCTAATSVEAVAGAAAAIAHLEAHHVDLVLTDIRMMDGDGFEILDWVREHCPRTLVTVITGFASMDSTIRAMRRGAFDYLVKPFDFELLTLSVERAMHGIETDRERDRAQAELQLWSRQLATINRIGRQATETLSEEQLLRIVARALHEEFGFYHVYFAMRSAKDDQLTIRAQAGAYEGRMPSRYTFGVDTGITGKVIRSAESVILNDVTTDADYYPLIPQTRSQAALPLVVDGKTIGALSVESAELSSFSDTDVTLLQTLVDIVTSSIKTIRLFQQMKETKDYLEVLLESSADAIVTTDPRGIITYFSPGAESVYGYTAAEVMGKPVSDYYEGGAAEAEKIMRELQARQRLRDYEMVLLARDGRRAYASISASLLQDRKGKVIGTLGVSKDITQRVELERMLKELTITDELTGLHNQRYFYRKVSSEMERARRQEGGLSLMLFDLDHFKEYNDTRGHVEGDKLLREIGRCVLDTIRNLVDSAYRYGGDEFTVLLPDVTGDRARSVAERIKRTVETALEGKVTLSVGLVAFRPELSPEEFINLADEAMYESKKERRNRIVCR